MTKRKHYGGGRNQGKTFQRERLGSLTEQERADLALISVMKDYPLEPGQMLLLGPKSVRILTTPGAFAGKLPDKLILDKHEWAVV